MDRPARQPEAFGVPRRLAEPPALIHSLAVFDEIAGGHDRVDELHRFGAGEVDLVALEQELQRVGRRHHARDPLRAAGAREQADLDLRQSESRLALSAAMRRWQASASSKPPPTAVPLIAATHGLPQVSTRRHSSDSLRLSSNRRAFAASSPCECDQFHEGAAQGLQHGEIGAAQNVSLPDVMTAPFTAASVAVCLTIAASSFDHRSVDDIHRAARHVPGHERDAVGAGFEGEILKAHRWSRVPLPSPPALRRGGGGEGGGGGERYGEEYGYGSA